MSRKINQAGLDLVKGFEGFYGDAYICPAGVLTIGYGHTGDAVPTELCRWLKATDPATGQKRTLAGLVRRRSAEGELWLLADEGVVDVQTMPQRIEPPIEFNCYRVNARNGLRLGVARVWSSTR